MNRRRFWIHHAISRGTFQAASLGSGFSWGSPLVSWHKNIDNLTEAYHFGRMLVPNSINTHIYRSLSSLCDLTSPFLHPLYLKIAFTFQQSNLAMVKSPANGGFQNKTTSSTGDGSIVTFEYWRLIQRNTHHPTRCSRSWRGFQPLEPKI